MAGDTGPVLCTLCMLQELHSVYYEPLAQECPSVEHILAGPPVKKLLFMTDPAHVDEEVRPHWEVGCCFHPAPPCHRNLLPTTRGKNAAFAGNFRDSVGHIVVQGITSLKTRTQVMQAVPSMLELVPSGVNKWVALKKVLLPDLALSPYEVMAIGDGGNDYEMVANVGLGVAMGNAVPKVMGLCVRVL